MSTGRSSEESENEAGYGPAAVATVTLSLVTWPIAFNLGVHGEVFYDDVFRLVVASAVAFAMAAVASPYEGWKRWFTQTALAAPALWFALAVMLFDSTAAAASAPVLGTVGLVIVVVAVPTALMTLMDMFTPDLLSLRQPGLLVYAAVVVVVVALAGFAVGANNDAFMTCADFEIAGAAQPSNCTQG